MSVGVLEEAQVVLSLQNRKHHFVKIALTHFTFVHKSCEIVRVSKACHIHVQTCGNGFVSRVFSIFRVTMRYQTAYGKCIRENDALETPVFSQHICEQQMIPSCWHFLYK